MNTSTIVEQSIGRSLLRLVVLLAGVLCLESRFCDAEEQRTTAKTVAPPVESRCVVLELYVKQECAACPEVAERLQKFADATRGIELRIYDLDQPGKHAEKFQQILHYYRLDRAELPAVYGCNYFLANLRPSPDLEQRIKALLTVEVFVRAGCPKCAKAEEHLAKIQPRYPALQFRVRDILSDVAARDRVQKLADRYHKQAASVPVYYFCNQLIIGFSGEESTGRELETKLEEWTVRCSAESSQDQTSLQSPGSLPREQDQFAVIRNDQTLHAAGLFTVALVRASQSSDESPDQPQPAQRQSEPQPSAVPLTDDPAELPIPEETELGPVPRIPDESASPPPVGPPAIDGDERPPPDVKSGDSINVPLLGTLSESRLGMPVFTFLIGLVDGFNPCAMWVLLFLLSVLVNLHDRMKILAVAGTFVVVSGLAYFAFMAAWLNVFLLVGYLRWAQIALGLLAVAIGSVHVKDFFAFKQGLSFSIPESAKPGIYERVRKIVTAENLTGAVVGAIALAVLVNIIELLCTAGLPAMYTEILTMQCYSAWKNYAYLGLYNLAYMFDDILMVGIVVITLSRHKLQERGGRWLKLVSGAAILALGVVMICKPEWLV